MKNIWKWILMVVALFLVSFCIALPVLSLLGINPALPMRFMAGSGFGSRMAMPGYGMMGGGFFGSGLLAIVGIALRCVLPLLLVGGIIAVFVLLLRRHPAATPAPSTAKVCSACKKPVEAEWVACPYCGQKL